MTNDAIVALTIDRFETGVFTDDPSDSGGATRWGITQLTLQRYRRRLTGNPHLRVTRLDVEHLTRDEAVDCALHLFLTEPQYVLLLDWRVRLAVFDFGFHSSPARATTELQALFPALDPDGICGPATQAAVNAHPDPQQLAMHLLVARSRFLLDLMKRREKDRKYARGWWERVCVLQELVSR
jgi:lysozyme family protein